MTTRDDFEASFLFSKQNIKSVFFKLDSKSKKRVEWLIGSTKNLLVLRKNKNFKLINHSTGKIFLRNDFSFKDGEILDDSMLYTLKFENRQISVISLTDLNKEQIILIQARDFAKQS